MAVCAIVRVQIKLSRYGWLHLILIDCLLFTRIRIDNISVLLLSHFLVQHECMYAYVRTKFVYDFGLNISSVENNINLYWNIRVYPDHVSVLSRSMVCRCRTVPHQIILSHIHLPFVSVRRINARTLLLSIPVVKAPSQTVNSRAFIVWLKYICSACGTPSDTVQAGRGASKPTQ